MSFSTIPKKSVHAGSRAGSVPTTTNEKGKSVEAKEEPKTATAGGDSFYAFEKQIDALDEQLRKLSNEARQLGSSVGILSAASRLRERLGRVLYLFRENAADLFPQKVKRKDNGVPIERHLNARTKVHHLFNYISDLVPAAHLDRKHLPQELHMFSNDISTLLQCFSQFPDFVDEIPDRSLGDDLTHWSTFLKDFEDDFKSQAVQMYLYDSMADIGERLDRITKRFIPIFIEIGIPTIRASQEHSVTDLTNLSTVATLFSSVTANMLAFSYMAENNALSNAVNTFWFVSLIFSISAAVNSLLGLTWTQAIFRSPDHRIPWWVRIWIKRSPLAFLVLSVACFSVGLVLFSYWSNQARVTSTITTVLSCLCSFGLAAMSSWFACEFWVYSRFGGHLWLADLLALVKEKQKELVISLWGIVHPHTVWKRGKGLIKDNMNIDNEKQLFPRIGFGRLQQNSTNNLPEEQGSSFWLTCDKSSMNKHEIARHRWHEAARRINEMHRLRMSEVILSLAEAPIYAKKLERMEVAYELSAEKAHKALVRVLEFSPDGRSLVTSSWDRKSFILDVQSEELACLGTIIHPSEPGFVHQLEWSPDGNRLLMRQNRCVSSWSDWNEGSAYRLFTSQPSDSEHTVRSVGWYRDGEGCLSAEGGRIVSITGTHQESLLLVSHRIENLAVRDFAVTKDSQWMLCVGQYPNDDDKSPKKKYQIALCSLKNYKIFRRAPVYREMSSITLADNDRSALVSYEDKAPPQLWEMHIFMDRALNLVLRHTYIPDNHTPKTAFAGLPSIFGGTQDQFVLRAGIAGDIFVWMRDTATLLHTIQAPAILGHLTAFAWNRGAEDWMFATGTLEGTVQIWTVRPEGATPTTDTAPDSSQVTLAGNGGTSSVGGSLSPNLRRRDTGSSAGWGTFTDSPTRERFATPTTERPRGPYFEGVLRARAVSYSSAESDKGDDDTRSSSPLRHESL